MRSNSEPRGNRKWQAPPWGSGVVLLLLLLFALSGWWLHQRRIATQLLTTDPDEILSSPDLIRQAVAIGRPAFERHCAACHGLRLQGNPKRGVPDLATNAWLYGTDPVDVERTILYGIRSGHPKSRNLTDMPSLVLSGQITTNDARDTVEYLQSLAGHPHDEAAAQRGRSIYYDKGNCYDCHANDAKGVIDYGTPALTGPVYLYGGDRATLFESILYGRHGQCPAWIARLSPVQVRALTIYLVTAPRTGVSGRS
jgi:cytochrome c oxidase cbb3-type subunit III